MARRNQVVPPIPSMGSAPSSAVLSSSGAPADPVREDFGSIDKSVRGPVATLLGWAAIWLLVGLTLSLVAAWKLHTPQFLGGCEWLTYGRIDPAATNVLLYGWGFNAALAVAFWLVARLAGTAMRSNPLSVVAILFWNLAVAVGAGGILLGHSTSLEWLEFPGYVSPVLLVTFAVLGSSLVGTLRDRRYASIFISQWYVVGAVFWFAWLYSVAQLMLVFFPVRGTVQSIVNAWYSQGLLALWFGSIALASLYYFIPKILGRPIRHYYLASLGFWTFAVLNGWLGVQRLIGSPVPPWVQSVGTAASLLSLAPLVVICINLLVTLAQNFGSAKDSLVLRFMTFASVAFAVSGLQVVLTSFGKGAAATHLTLAAQSQPYLAFFGFFTMAAFGAIYYLTPRIASRPWYSQGLIAAHFASTALGVVVVYLALLLGGLRQGAEIGSSDFSFQQIVTDLQPYLLARTAGIALLIIGQIAFLVNLFLTLARLPIADESPLVLPEPPQMEGAR